MPVDSSKVPYTPKPFGIDVRTAQPSTYDSFYSQNKTHLLTGLSSDFKINATTGDTTEVNAKDLFISTYVDKSNGSLIHHKVSMSDKKTEDTNLIPLIKLVGFTDVNSVVKSFVTPLFSALESNIDESERERIVNYFARLQYLQSSKAGHKLLLAVSMLNGVLGYSKNGDNKVFNDLFDVDAFLNTNVFDFSDKLSRFPVNIPEELAIPNINTVFKSGLFKYTLSDVDFKKSSMNIEMSVRFLKSNQDEFKDKPLKFNFTFKNDSGNVWKVNASLDTSFMKYEEAVNTMLDFTTGDNLFNLTKVVSVLKSLHVFLSKSDGGQTIHLKASLLFMLFWYYKYNVSSGGTISELGNTLLFNSKEFFRVSDLVHKFGWSKLFTEGGKLSVDDFFSKYYGIRRKRGKDKSNLFYALTNADVMSDICHLGDFISDVYQDSDFSELENPLTKFKNTSAPDEQKQSKHSVEVSVKEDHNSEFVFDTFMKKHEAKIRKVFNLTNPSGSQGTTTPYIAPYVDSGVDPLGNDYKYGKAPYDVRIDKENS